MLHAFRRIGTGLNMVRIRRNAVVFPAYTAGRHQCLPYSGLRRFCIFCDWEEMIMKQYTVAVLGATGAVGQEMIHILEERIFPSAKKDPQLAGSLSANVCANFLGLGNAATPMGIAAARRLKNPGDPTLATDEMCRLIVLNTASIQFLPTNVAAVRSALGCPSPFDILPAVWVSSLLSASLGVLAAWCLGRVWKR